MDGLREGPQDDPMPYGVDTIRLRISFPPAPAPRGYNGRAWKMRPLRGWTGGARWDAQQAERETAASAGAQGGYADEDTASGMAGAAQPVNAGSSLRATLDRVIAAMSAEAPAVAAHGGGQFVKVASELPAGPAPSADAANGESGLTALHPGDAPPAAAQAGTPSQPSPDVEEHGRLWWWLHDHGLVHTRHEQADLIRKAYGPGSGRLVVDGNGVPIDLDQLSDDEVIALGEKLLETRFELPFIWPAAPVDEPPKPGGESAASSRTADSGIASTPETRLLSPSELRFSQRTAGGRGRVQELRPSMAERGWDGPPIDAVRTPEGIVTIDNTRVALAQELGIGRIPVRVWNPSDPLPQAFIRERRFGASRTWGEVLAHRTGRQRPPLDPTGTTQRPRLPRGNQ